MVCLLPRSTFVFFPFRWSARGRILLWGRHWRRRMYGLWQLLPPQQTRTLCQSCGKTWWDSFIRHLTSHREGEITYRAKVSSGSCRVLCNKKLWYHEQDVIRELSLSSFPLWLAEGFNVARLIYAAYCISVLKNVSEEDMKSRWGEIWAVAICFIWKEENSWRLSIQPFICLFSLFFDLLINVRCLGWKINWESLFDGWQAGFNVKDESAAAFTSTTQSGLRHILTGGHFRWIILQSYVTVNNSQFAKRAGFGSDHSHTLECFGTQMGTLAMFYFKSKNLDIGWNSHTALACHHQQIVFLF